MAHCSGAASLGPLESASEQGAYAGAFHPLQAFSSVDEGIQNIPGVTFGIESAPEIRDYLEQMAHDIGGNPIFLRPEDKVLYHLSGVLMGNLLAVLASVAASVWPKFDHTRDEGIQALTPMMGAVARNLDANGVPQGVAGPYPRGDVGTIRKHLEALKSTRPGVPAAVLRAGPGRVAFRGGEGIAQRGAICRDRTDGIRIQDRHIVRS